MFVLQLQREMAKSRKLASSLVDVAWNWLDLIISLLFLCVLACRVYTITWVHATIDTQLATYVGLYKVPYPPLQIRTPTSIKYHTHLFKLEHPPL